MSSFAPTVVTTPASLPMPLLEYEQQQSPSDTNGILQEAYQRQTTMPHPRIQTSTSNSSASPVARSPSSFVPLLPITHRTPTEKQFHVAGSAAADGGGDAAIAVLPQYRTIEEEEKLQQHEHQHHHHQQQLYHQYIQSSPSKPHSIHTSTRSSRSPSARHTTLPPAIIIPPPVLPPISQLTDSIIGNAMATMVDEYHREEDGTPESSVLRGVGSPRVLRTDSAFHAGFQGRDDLRGMNGGGLTRLNHHHRSESMSTAGDSNKMIGLLDPSTPSGCSEHPNQRGAFSCSPSHTTTAAADANANAAANGGEEKKDDDVEERMQHEADENSLMQHDGEEERHDDDDHHHHHHHHHDDVDIESTPLDLPQLPHLPSYPFHDTLLAAQHLLLPPDSLLLLPPPSVPVTPLPPLTPISPTPESHLSPKQLSALDTLVALSAQDTSTPSTHRLNSIESELTRAMYPLAQRSVSSGGIGGGSGGESRIGHGDSFAIDMPSGHGGGRAISASSVLLAPSSPSINVPDTPNPTMTTTTTTTAAFIMSPPPRPHLARIQSSNINSAIPLHHTPPNSASSIVPGGVKMNMSASPLRRPSVPRAGSRTPTLQAQPALILPPNVAAATSASTSPLPNSSSFTSPPPAASLMQGTIQSNHVMFEIDRALTPDYHRHNHLNHNISNGYPHTTSQTPICRTPEPGSKAVTRAHTIFNGQLGEYSGTSTPASERIPSSQMIHQVHQMMTPIIPSPALNSSPSPLGVLPKPFHKSPRTSVSGSTGPLAPTFSPTPNSAMNKNIRPVAYEQARQRRRGSVASSDNITPYATMMGGKNMQGGGSSQSSSSVFSSICASFTSCCCCCRTRPRRYPHSFYFSFILSLMIAVLLILSCGTVWYVSYTLTTTNTNTYDFSSHTGWMTRQVEVWQDTKQEVVETLGQARVAIQVFSQMVRKDYPTLADPAASSSATPLIQYNNFVTLSPGLSSLLLLNSLHPTLRTIGFMNQDGNGMSVVMTTTGGGSTAAAAAGKSILISQVDGGSELTTYTYSPSSSTITSYSTSAEIEAYLGAVAAKKSVAFNSSSSSSSSVQPSFSEYHTLLSQLRLSGMNRGWIQPLFRNTSGSGGGGGVSDSSYLSLRMYERLESGSVTSTAATSPVLAYVDLDLTNYLSNLFSSSSNDSSSSGSTDSTSSSSPQFQPNDSIYLWSMDGVLLASSSSTTASSSGMIESIAQSLAAECQLIVSGEGAMNSSSINTAAAADVAAAASSQLYNTSSIPSSTTSASDCRIEFLYNSSSYLLQSSLLSPQQTGLPYLLVLVTKVGDYQLAANLSLLSDSSVSSTSTSSLPSPQRQSYRHNIITYTTIIVLPIMIFLGWIISLILTKPIVRIVNSMETLIDLLHIENGVERKRALKILQMEWMNQTSSSDGTGSNHAAGTGNLMNEDTNSATSQQQSQPQNSPLREAELRQQREKQQQQQQQQQQQNNSNNNQTTPAMPHSLIHEVNLMQRVYSSMLSTMGSFDELKVVDDAKKRFIRYIFHEVRVPFNAIVLGIEQLQQDLIPLQNAVPDVLDTLRILNEQSEVVTHILNDVLSLQKIEDGALTLEYRAFDMERMVRATLYSFKASCLERQLKLRIQLMNLTQLAWQRLSALGRQQTNGGGGDGENSNNGGNVPTIKPDRTMRFGVWGDTHRLRQVLSNYVSNSIKFTPRGKEIRVSLNFDELEFHPRFITALGNMDGISSIQPVIGEHSVGRTLVRVVVSDQGRGIPLEHRANLFTTYTQIDAGTMQKSKGTGLGLSLSKSIIELHNGSVALDKSIEGEGSDFSFTIPMSVYLLPSKDRVQGNGDMTAGGDASTSEMPQHASSNSDAHTMFGTPKMVGRTPPNGPAAPGMMNGGTSGNNLNPFASPSFIPTQGDHVPSLNTGGSTAFGGTSPQAEKRPPITLRMRPHFIKQKSVPVDNTQTDGVAGGGGGGGGGAQNSVGNTEPHTSNSSTGTSNRGSTDSPVTTPIIQPHPPLTLVTSPEQQPSLHRLRTETLIGSDKSPPLANRPGGVGISPSTTLTQLTFTSMHHQTINGQDTPLGSPANYSENALTQQSNSLDTPSNNGQHSSGGGSGTSSSPAMTAITPASTQPLRTSPSIQSGRVRSMSITKMMPRAPSSETVAFHPAPVARTFTPTPLRVLVVEDSAVNRKLLCQLLTRFKCQVSQAEDGQQCVDYFKSSLPTQDEAASLAAAQLNELVCPPSGSPTSASSSSSSSSTFVTPGTFLNPNKSLIDQHCQFDLILMDNTMPNLDGCSATRILRSRGLTIPIVGVTGNCLQEDIDLFKNAGANEVLTKPVSSAQLASVLKKYNT